MNIERNNNDIAGSRGQLDRLASDGNVDSTKLNDAVDSLGQDLREFGIEECAESAKEIFTPEVLERWGEMSPEERAALAMKYGDKVAENFHLVDYKGVVIEDMDPGVLGYNRGDGYAHLNAKLITGLESPLQIIDTITHELRHQYQNESIRGYHPVPEETRKEWEKGMETYTNNQPWAYDPWGYKYNPLETDARYAGESVVREFTKDFINENNA